MAFNPMAVLTGMYQRLFLGGETDWFSLAPVLVLALLFCVLGLALFRRHAGDMVEWLLPGGPTSFGKGLLVSIHARSRATTTFGRGYASPERDHPLKGRFPSGICFR
jgi:hypothetical protein